jgi:hypothetical protein
MPEPHEVATLLPWYLNGTLSPAEAGEVERHLAGCASCRAEMEEWRRLRPALDSAVASRPLPPADLFAAVRRRIEADSSAPVRRATPEAPWWERLAAAVFGVLPPRLAPAAALAVIVLQFGALAVVGTIAQQALRGPSVTTQSDSVEQRPLPEGMARLRVAFRPDPPEGEIRALLQRLEARVADGPSAAGFYIVEAPATIGDRPVTDLLQEQAALIGLVERISP